MAHNTIIQAVKIYCNVVAIEHTELGLYTYSCSGNTTATSKTITAISDTSHFFVGQLVSCPLGFGDTVLRKVVSIVDNTSITLDTALLHTITGTTIYSESELRWSEYPLVGMPENWVSGIIGAGGLGAEKVSADFSRSGALPSYDGFTIKAINTNQMILRLKELGVYLSGRTVEKWEFEGTEADSDSVSSSKLFTGDIQDLEGIETIFSIPVKNNRLKSNVCIGTIINNDATNGNYPKANDNKNGEIIPVTFGKLYPDSANTSEKLRAKAIRISEKQTTLTNDDGKGNYYTPRGMSYFPIVGTDGVSPFLTYYIQIGTDLPGTFPTHIADFVGKYIQVVVGGSSDPVSLVGKYRKISAYDIIDVFTGTISLTLDSFFEKDLSGNSTATGTNQAWIKIVDIPIEHLLDDFPCQGFLDESGTPIVANDYPRLAVYDSATDYVPLPNYGFTADVDSATKASLKIDIKQFEEDPTKLNAYSIFPVSNLGPYVKSDLTELNRTDLISVESGKNGYNAYAPQRSHFTHSTAEYPEYATDRRDDTYYYNRLTLELSSVVRWDASLVYQFAIPFSDIKIEYDAYYIGCNMLLSYPHLVTPTANGITFLWKRFIGATHEINTNTAIFNKMFVSEYPMILTVDCLPDFYYLTRTQPDNNKNFYFNIDTSASWLKKVTGLNLFKLDGITTIDNLKSITNIFLHHRLYADNADSLNNPYIETDIAQLAIVCQKSFSISDAIYANFGGRVFNDTDTSTWNTEFSSRYGKTSTDLIDSPAAILEHLCRLQNNNDNGDAVNSGHVYSPSALIATEKFDALPAELRGANTGTDHNYTPAFQIFDASKAYTDSLKQQICEQYFLCSYQDAFGRECVEEITELQSPSASVDLRYILGNIPATKEAQAQNIFVAPFVNYCYNSSSQKFDKILQILNPQDCDFIKPDGTLHTANTGWEPALTPGFKNTDGQAVWIKCHNLWNKFKQVEQPPSNLTDRVFDVTYSDALAAITKWVNWMDKKRQSFSIPYTYSIAIGRNVYRAKNWNIAQHIKISFPHQTNGWAIECIIEGITKNKADNKIDIDVVLLQDIPTSFYKDRYQNTIAVSDLASWQNVANGTGLDNYQDEV